MYTDSTIELYLLVDLRICMEEAECNRRRESKILTVFRLFIIEFLVYTIH